MAIRWDLLTFLDVAAFGIGGAIIKADGLFRWLWRRNPGEFSCRTRMSATLENGADATLENEATGSAVSVCRVLGSELGFTCSDQRWHIHTLVGALRRL
jgi:hypothetical protein